MSTLRLTTLSNQGGTASVPSQTVISGTAKAWVNFNGQNTVAIRAAFNVSSITDNGSGDYTVNFTTALSDANYSVSFAGSDASWGSVVTVNYNNAPTTTTTRIRIAPAGGGSNSDIEYVNLAFFR